MEVSARIQSVRGAYQCLFNDDLAGAKTSLEETQSPFHLTALGLVKFLEAALGSEQQEMLDALDILAQASEVATAFASEQKAKAGTGAELASKVLVADSLSSQAVIHLFMESYTETMKAVYKLNKAHGVISSLSKSLFPKDVKESDSIATITAKLNESYTNFKSPSNLTPSTLFQLGHKANGSASSLWSWGSRQKKPELRHAASTGALSSSSVEKKLPVEPSKLSVGPTPPLHRRANSATNIHVSHGQTLMVPGMGIRLPDDCNSVQSSRASSIRSGKSEGSVVGDENTVALWEGDEFWAFIICGGIWGRGIFELIFSSLPSKVRKLISFFGYKHSNRTIALNLLEVAATTSDGPHSAFACLTLISFITFYLQLSGWQADKQASIARAENLLSIFEERYPSGSLAALNRAKLLRVQRDLGGIEILEAALARKSGFRQADRLMVFELSMTYLAEDEHQKAADHFLQMRHLSNWSHPTYVFIAAGALIQVQPRTPELHDQITTLFRELGTLVGKKRLLGSAPATEVFIVRRMEAYKTKYERWVKQGRLKKEAEVWECIRISPATEIAYLWNANGGASFTSLETQRLHLESLTPPPCSPPSTFTSSSASSFDLDTVEESLIRDLLLGQVIRNQPCTSIPHPAREIFNSILSSVTALGSSFLGETWVVPYTYYELALIELAESDVDGEWKKHLMEAERWLERVTEKGGFDMRNRLEVRCGMLREEIGAKRKALVVDV